jgi:predicted MFS family arabinose efflux permease
MATRRTSILFLLTSALQVTDNEVVALLARGMSREFFEGVTTSDVLRLLVTYPIGAALAPLLITTLWPSLRPTRAVLYGLALIAMSQGAMCFSPSLEVAMLLRAVAGAGSGILAYALLHSAANEGAALVTAMTVGFLLGMVAGVPLSALIVGFTGIVGFYAVLAALSSLLLFAHVLRDRRMADEPPWPTPPKRFLHLLRAPVYARALLASVLVAAAIGAPMALFPTALQTDGALSLSQVGVVYLVAGLGPLLAWPVTSRVLRRFGAWQAARIGAATLALPLLLLPMSAATAISATILLFAALWVETLRRSAMQHHVATLAEGPDRARFLAVRNVLTYLGIALGRLGASLLPGSSALLLASLLGAGLALASSALLPAGRNSTAK